MPVRAFPFIEAVRTPGNHPGPFLWIRILNPCNGWGTPPILALLDTGASFCDFPAVYAELLKHNYKAGTRVESGGIGGEEEAYTHLTQIQILETRRADGNASDKIVYTTEPSQVVYGRRVPIPLLGTVDFLRRFVLKVDYPTRLIWLRKPDMPGAKRVKKKRRRRRNVESKI